MSDNNLPGYLGTREIQNDLHQLLLDATPDRADGRPKTLGDLADALNMSKWGVHKWVKGNGGKGHLPPNAVVRIMEIATDRVKFEDFHVHVYGVDPAKYSKPHGGGNAKKK